MENKIILTKIRELGFPTTVEALEEELALNGVLKKSNIRDAIGDVEHGRAHVADTDDDHRACDEAIRLLEKLDVGQ